MSSIQQAAANLQGEPFLMHDLNRCQRQGCSQVAVSTFRGERFCLEHFCSRCYQFLEWVSQRLSDQPPGVITIEEALMADECARRTIDICLTSEHLNNLDRARLLDILLWCGDISAAFCPENDRNQPRDTRLSYEKPQVRRLNANAASLD